MPDVGDLVEVILASVIIYPVYRFRKSLGKKHIFQMQELCTIIKQRLEDIELQRWFSEMNNDTRKDPNQSNKMFIYKQGPLDLKSEH